ncbi:hypothetical protein J113_05195 [Mycobacterium tuberculosis CAS/NITR204]|uniref:Uncharacterized protein n=1 Tax=Mycobacterium tuberculosis CAS/NITR204 TaxID=1310114 RepID=R4M5X4_MYCTX|nr:hypothetical protein J113_05195 [Mycobacterium tuberculosis CAS/NITR204]
MGGNEAIGPGGWLDGAGRPSPDLLVAADDVLDQIVDRPLRAGRGAAGWSARTLARSAANAS